MNYNLSKIEATPPAGVDEASTRLATKQLIGRLGELQHLLYAEGKRALLVVLQGMDASGKDGAIRKVFSKCNLFGTEVVSFGKPSDREREHDFLWRVHQRTPGRGKLTIFNRSQDDCDCSLILGPRTARAVSSYSRQPHALNGRRSRPFSIPATETKDLYDPDSAVSFT